MYLCVFLCLYNAHSISCVELHVSLNRRFQNAFHLVNKIYCSNSLLLTEVVGSAITRCQRLCYLTIELWIC
jgi:hypothetical protein